MNKNSRVKQFSLTTIHNEHNALLCNQLCNEIDVALMLIAYPSGELLYVNQKVCDDLEMSYDALVGSNYRDFFMPEFYSVYEDLADKCQDTEVHTTIYYWTERVIWEQISAKLIRCRRETLPYGTSLFCSAESTIVTDISHNSDVDTLHDEAGLPPKLAMATDDTAASSGENVILLNITNITELARKEHEQERIIYFDSLTGLPNGRKLELDIAELDCVKEVGLLYFQIENFDDIVDPYGWGAGDQLYLLIRDWLLESETRRAQFYKGERGFIGLGKGISRKDTIERIETIIDRFNLPWTLIVNGQKLSIYCKIRIGGVLGEYVRKEVRTLLLRTMKMNAYKGSEYTIYDKEEDKLVRADHKLKYELINSILDDMKGFSVSYQPIVEAASGAWVGLEALCRWKSSAESLVPPLEFIPAIQQIGFMPKVDAWVRREALKQCGKLGLNTKVVFLDVNYSPGEPVDEAYIQEIVKDCEDTNFPFEHLIIEITEAEKMRFDEANLKGLETLRRLGIILSLDDFGTGYSSLENLLKISATVLKTDKSLIDHVTHSAEEQYLMRVLINLAHHLNMKIIVEGVETERQRKMIAGYGADYIQGYLFSRPLTAEQLAQNIWRFDDLLVN